MDSPIVQKEIGAAIAAARQPHSYGSKFCYDREFQGFCSSNEWGVTRGVLTGGASLIQCGGWGSGVWSSGQPLRNHIQASFFALIWVLDRSCPPAKWPIEIFLSNSGYTSPPRIKPCHAAQISSGLNWNIRNARAW